MLGIGLSHAKKARNNPEAKKIGGNSAKTRSALVPPHLGGALVAQPSGVEEVLEEDGIMPENGSYLDGEEDYGESITEDATPEA